MSENKYTADDLYPSVAVFFKMKVLQDERTSRWHWESELFIEGPDDVFNRQSPAFDSKEKATFNMLSRTSDVFKELLDEANS